MPDFERLTDQLSIDLAETEKEIQYALGFIAGKTKARREILTIIIALYFIIALIGYITR